METKNNMSFADMIQSTQPVLVDFTATWCGPCKMMSPILEELKKDVGDRVRILKVDVDKNPQIASQYRIQSFPSLILFKAGETLWRQSGVVPVKLLRDIIEKYNN